MGYPASCVISADGFAQVLEGMIARRESPDSDTWLMLLNAVGTAGALDKAVELMERSRAEGQTSEVLHILDVVVVVVVNVHAIIGKLSIALSASQPCGLDDACLNPRLALLLVASFS